MNFENKNMEIPDSLPLLPVRDSVVFPDTIHSLYVGRDSSIQAVEESLSKNRLIFLSSQKDLSEENPSEDSIFSVGTVSMIIRMRKLSDGRVKILVQGLSKRQILHYKKSHPFFEVTLSSYPDKNPGTTDSLEIEALIRNAKEKLEKIIALGKLISPDVLLIFDDVSDPSRMADLITSNLGLKVADAQKVLETQNPIEKLTLVTEILQSEIDVLQVQTKIRNNAKEEMNKSQREYFLREQMRAIKNELGETDSKSEEIDDLRTKLNLCEMPQQVKKEALKQLGRLERMHPDASEASMLRSYLDLMIDLPWTKHTDDVLDLSRAQAILDEDHFDLHKVKDRILEFLAVRKLKNNSTKGPILCFSGPPGVGKTSLGRSIARSMGREYFRIALGGVKDEAEIRGHRRTYVGAMPGKIIQALQTIKTNNPVIVLDEIDKLGSDFRGDPSAAMLEVLDPEQNITFRDNYLNVDFDLSNVLFIATANVVENIPAALRDRMEMIPLSGYTQNDKVKIAQKHLIHRQIENNGISPHQVSFTEEGLFYLVTHYTREAGLRNLEREIGSLCRKVAKMVVTGFDGTLLLDPNKITDLLGSPRFIKEESLKESQIGVVTGLAWTQAGGEILYIEALKMMGKGQLKLTGQLGDVMKESAQAALSYAKAHFHELDISEKWFEENDVHVHIPAGAIPKDGPSAGITMSTALISLMTGVPVRRDIAMTGEVTLTGRVLPVGGIKEKVLAALNHDIHTVILPMANKKDVVDIPQQYKDQMNFIYVENVDEVIALALENSMSDKTSKKNKKHKKKSPSAEAA